MKGFTPSSEDFESVDQSYEKFHLFYGAETAEMAHLQFFTTEGLLYDLDGRFETPADNLRKL